MVACGLGMGVRKDGHKRWIWPYHAKLISGSPVNPVHGLDFLIIVEEGVGTDLSKGPVYRQASL